MEAKEEYEQSNKTTELLDIFYKYLEAAIADAKDMLIERYKWICSQDPASAKFMYENNIMLGYKPEEGIESAMRHGTLAIGNLGLAECLQVLVQCDHTSDRGMKIAKKIYQLFSTKASEYKQQYRLNFGVYMTPAENLSHTALKRFREKYGVIPNVSDKEFFTNSMHVPVWYNMSPFDKIDIESQLTGYSSAGCITYVEFDSVDRANLEAMEMVVNYAMDHDIPYFAINVANDTCLECGFNDEIPEGECCPKCGGQNIQRLRRVTGYLTNDFRTAFNQGKQQEVELRTKHQVHLKE